MRQNISYNAGNLILIDKVDQQYNFFGSIFQALTGKTKHLIESVKAFINNRLDKCVSVNQITEIYPEELFNALGFKETPKQRTLYRDLERIGIRHPLIVERYQQLLNKNDLVSNIQFPDFSSSYFEGDKAELGALGYSRDGKPGKKQITFGIQVGENTLPTALTIQKGNVCDKKHFKFMLKLSEKVLDEDSVLVFDCGANTKENKRKIRKHRLNYLTLRPKRRDIYRKLIEEYKKLPKRIFYINGRKYKCVEIKEDNEIKYIYHCKRLYKDSRRKRNKKFKKELQKNKKLAEKVKRGKEISRMISEEGYIIMKGAIQKTLHKIDNPYITGLEGFFILESSLDDEPYKILKLYKDRDKAEKLIRDMKEGTELRPINHMSKEAVIGYLVIVFLTNCLISLTHFMNGNTNDKNLKLLKKKLNNLTVTVIYDKSVFKFSVLSNILPEIRELIGDSLKKFREKPPDWV